MEQDKAQRPGREVLANVRLGLAATLFAYSWLTIIKAPHELLWKPTIFITEVGHLFALVPLALTFGRLRLRRSRLAFALALAAALLCLSPLARCLLSVDDLVAPARLAFPDGAPFEGPGAPARPAPMVIGDLWRFGVPEVPTRTLTFSPQHGLTLDLHALPTQDGAPRPLVIFVHGGGWSTGDSTQLPDINRHLAARGLIVAALNYRKAPEHPFPAAHEDVLAAIAWLKAHADEHGIDASKIALVGRSAGAHLALMAAYSAKDPSIRGVFGLYGPTDLNWSWDHPANPLLYPSRKVLRDFLGGSPDERPEAYRDSAPLTLAHPGAPPTLLMHGGRDGLVSLRQSERLAARLDEIGVRHALVALPWSNHAFDANLYGPSGQPYVYCLERFLGDTLR